MRDFKILFALIMASSIFFISCESDEDDSIITPNDEATESVVYEMVEGDPIPNSYIIEFSDKDFKGLSLMNSLDYDSQQYFTNSHARTVLNDHKIFEYDIEHTYAASIKGVHVKISEDEVQKLLNDPRVVRIEQDHYVHLQARGGNGNKPDKGGGGSDDPAQSTPWGINRVGTGDGSGKTAWILDTGVDLDHNDLNVNKNKSVSFVGGRKDTPDDQHGHGTHVAGTIAAKNNSIGVIGVAADATVVSVRVLDRNGSGSYSGIISGVDYVAANASAGDVANMSLGGSANTSLDNAVKSAASNGIHFVLAAGNSSADANYYSPARANGTYIHTISAMNSQDVFASFSNYGSPVDYCAPGVSIASLWKNGGYNTISGTSMAAPHVAGLLLLSSTLNTDGTVSNDPDGDPDPIAHK